MLCGAISSGATGAKSIRQAPGQTAFRRWVIDWAFRNAATCAPPYGLPLSVTLVMARKPIAPGANGRRNSTLACACVRAGGSSDWVGVAGPGLGMTVPFGWFRRRAGARRG